MFAAPLPTLGTSTSLVIPTDAPMSGARIPLESEQRN